MSRLVIEVRIGSCGHDDAPRYERMDGGGARIGVHRITLAPGHLAASVVEFAVVRGDGEGEIALSEEIGDGVSDLIVRAHGGDYGLRAKLQNKQGDDGLRVLPFRGMPRGGRL